MIKPPECLDCVLGKRFPNKDGELITLGRGFTKNEGRPRFGVHIVGDFAGRAEEQEGLPFRANGESGSLITSLIGNLNVTDELGKSRKMNRGDFSWDNLVKCRPPSDELGGKSYENEALEGCQIYSQRSYAYSGIDSISLPPVSFNKVILALGPIAFKYFTGISGKKRSLEDVRGYVFRSNNFAALVIGSLHPRYIRSGNARRTNALIYDVKKALSVANATYTSYRDHSSFTSPVFVLQDKIQALVSFYYKCRDNPSLTVYYDIENPYTKHEEEDDKGDLEEENEADTGNKSSNEITSIQFGTDITWAITVPWQKPFIKVAQAILALGNEKVGSNSWHHDNPRLEANGCKINGLNHDLMWAWHHLQPGLWKGLQRIGSFFDVPYDWKYLALQDGNDDEYGCMDVIAPAYIWPKLVRKMKAVGVWESYLKFKLKTRALVLRPAEIRGMPVDIVEHSEFKTYIESEVKSEDDKLQYGVPEHLRNIKPQRKRNIAGVVTVDYGYLREPRIIGDLRRAYNVTRDKMLEAGTRDSSIIPFEQWATRKSGLVFKQFGRILESRWCRVEPFKASSQQLVKYLKSKGYDVPKSLKSGKDTTGKKELQEVWEKTGDELLGSVIRIRSYSKMLSNDIPNWLPDKDGVVRTTFKFDPPNLQLNSSSPNIQNASKHPKEWELFGKVAGELQLVGQRFRRIVKAPPGRCVVEFDKSGFHVGMMGFQAKDPLYIKWAIHLHTIFASYIAGEPIAIEGEIDLNKINYVKKKYKTIRDSQAKPTVLGNQLGLGANKLWYMNRTYIDSNGVRQIGIENKKRAKYLQEMLAHLFPKVEQYKKRIVEEAHFKSYLRSKHGVIRWFYDAMRWDWKERRLKNSTEAEQAISHNVQSDAFGMIHSENLDMAETSDILEEHWFANTIHDSDIFFPEIGKRDKCIEDVYKYMMKPDMVLTDPVCAPNGLVIKVDVMASPEGGNWATYHKERNPMGIQEIHV